MFGNFTKIVLFTLPWGNDGRGTPVKLFPVLGLIGFLVGTAIHWHFFA